MEAVRWSNLLPRLEITEEISRRDSITSEKTHDSGYNSDPEISLSPLNFIQEDKRFLSDARLQDTYRVPTLTLDPTTTLNLDVTSLSTPTTGSLVAHRSILLRRVNKEPKATKGLRREVTSNPNITTDPSSIQRKKWINAVDAIEGVTHLPQGGDATINEPESEIQHSGSRKDDVEQWIDESMPAFHRKERVSSIVSLSSTGSGSDYSITDSEAEETENMSSSLLSKSTIATIDLIMCKIEINLRHAAYVHCAGGQASRATGTGEPSRGGRGSTQNTGAKRKYRSDEGTPHEDPDDGSNKRRRVSITATEDSDSGPRFACPFYKHDPNRYRNRRTCPGPGWPTVHRMKEHLYRSHTQPIFCPRCYAMFDSDSDFSAHLRSNPCAMSAPQPIEGIDRETLKALRKRSPALRLEEDKWRDTYQLLFPDVPEADIPSPYYDSDSPTEESRRFRRELLERIRRELFATAEQESGPVEQSLLRQVAGIIQRCETELLESFFQQPSHSQPTRTPASNNQPTPLLTPISSSRRASHPSVLTPAPTPASSSIPQQLRTEAQMAVSQPIPSSAAPSGPYISNSPSQYSTMVWDDTYAVPSSEWIDWNVVFPVPDIQPIERNEGVPRLNTPVWT